MKKRNTLSFEKQNQALSRTAKGMEDLAGAQIKRTKLMIEAGKNRDGLFLKHKADEAQQTREYKAEEASKNREHELSLAQMYASVRPTSYLSQGDQWHLSAYRPYMQNLSGNSKNVQTNAFGQCEYLSHNHNKLRPPTYRRDHKNKKNMNKKRRFIVALMQMLSYLYSCILRIKTERLFC